MKKYQLYLSVIAASMLASCNQEDVKPGVNTKNISIGNVSTSSSATSRAEDVIVRELPPVEIDGNILTITETIRPIERAISRAEDADAMARLKNDGFDLRGWYEYAQGTKRGQLFNGSANKVQYTNDKWALTGEDYWRENSTHYFWANHGDIEVTGIGETPESLNFSFTSANGTTDLMLAYDSQIFKTKADVEETGSYIKQLNFTHALSRIVIKNEIKYYEPASDGATADVLNPQRASLLSVSINAVNKGNCVATNDNNGVTYTWTPGTDSKNQLVYDLDQPKEVGFIIPQVKGTISGTDCIRTLELKIFDNKHYDPRMDPIEDEKAIAAATSVKTVNVKLTSENETSTGNWLPGYEYTYTVKGKINFPYESYDIDTGNSFTGMGFQRLNAGVFDNTKEIASFTISWDGLPETNGNGTYGGVSLEPIESRTQVDPETIKYKYTDGKTLYTNYANLFWVYDAKNGKVLKGNYDPQTKRCSATVRPADIGITGAFRLWIIYLGGTAAQQFTKWELNDVQITVTYVDGTTN